MSTVRMSDYLKRDIVKKFRELYDKSNPPQKVPSHLADSLYTLTIGAKIKEFNQKANEIFDGVIESEKFFKKDTELLIKFPFYSSFVTKQYDETTGENVKVVAGEMEKENNLTIEMSSEVSVPIDNSSNWSSSTLALTIDPTTPATAQVMEQIISISEAESLRKAKKQIDVGKVEEAIEDFTTLNQALKAWPAVSKLVDQDKISKVHEKQERKRKENKARAKIKPIEGGLNQTILSATLLGDD